MKYFSFLLILALISCQNQRGESIIRKFGIDYNTTRSKLGLPLVSPDMVWSEDDPGRFRLTHAKKDKSSPRHVFKMLLIDSSLKLNYESDYFINPSLKSWLVVEHNYYRNNTTCKYQVESDSSMEVKVVPLSMAAFDSVLVSWKIKIMPGYP